ncbi:MAG: substrate-binding periplasmic protein [Leucobacter sp.]
MNTRSKKFAIVATMLAAGLTLSACSSGADSGVTGEDGSETRTIRVATSNDAPFSYVDEATGELTGIDGEMMNAMAEELGWEIEVVITDFQTLPQTIRSDKADIIVDAMYITEERQKVLNFSDTWYLQGEGMLVPAGSDLKSREDAEGKLLGAVTGTAHAELAQSLTDTADVKLFETQANLIQALANGQVEAGFTDQAVVAWSLIQNPNDKVELVDPYDPFFPGNIGAGFRQDAESDELREKLNGALADLKASPKYLEILKKYGLAESNMAE